MVITAAVEVIVSNYFRQRMVNREPVQCRMRWGNLAEDYKKIKEWEARIKDETESFWIMRSDLRRERRLPGCFDREALAQQQPMRPRLQLRRREWRLFQSPYQGKHPETCFKNYTGFALSSVTGYKYWSQYANGEILGG
ncbi:hypothetical protein SAY86_002603 [Trapa natans]|uniref:Myb/SANT-like DNA-binding domain-containing protein n=1 Tax=Trapa natans TaxID=22666 RepID=A0AAN7QZQ8_TRANT|nr:hypothetical protein SAY86_002603 [Trapa natans]